MLQTPQPRASRHQHVHPTVMGDVGVAMDIGGDAALRSRNLHRPKEDRSVSESGVASCQNQLRILTWISLANR